MTIKLILIGRDGRRHVSLHSADKFDWKLNTDLSYLTLLGFVGYIILETVVGF